MNRKRSNSNHKLIVRIFAVLLAAMFVLTLASQIFFYAGLM